MIRNPKVRRHRRRRAKTAATAIASPNSRPRPQDPSCLSELEQRPGSNPTCHRLRVESRLSGFAEAKARGVACSIAVELTERALASTKKRTARLRPRSTTQSIWLFALRSIARSDHGQQLTHPRDGALTGAGRTIRFRSAKRPSRSSDGASTAG